jgi:hypothetical protein
MKKEESAIFCRTSCNIEIFSALMSVIPLAAAVATASRTFTCRPGPMVELRVTRLM